MPLRISAHDLTRFASQTDRMKKAGEKVKHKVEGALRQVVRTTEISSMAFGASVLKGKVGEIALLGVPAELAVGLGGHLLGFFGIGGGMNHHLHNFADGAVASWVCGRGLAIGKTMRTPADEARIQAHAADEARRLAARAAPAAAGPAAGVHGELDGKQGTRLPQEQLDKAARPVAA